MATTERQRTGAVQDTGNPVFDATCNLIMNWPATIAFHSGGIDGLHEDLASLFAKEPKRMNAQPRRTMAEMAADANEKRVH